MHSGKRGTQVHLCVVSMAVGLVALPLGAGQAGPAPPQDYRDRFGGFTFATIADSHVRDVGGVDWRYLKAMDKDDELLATYVRDINARTPRVDFVVHLGDVTDLASPTEFAAARAVLDSLDCPMYPVVGNHDNFQSDAKAGWKAFAGLDSTTYSFDYLLYHFIVIDCTLDPYVSPYVTCDSTLRAWVADDLAANADRPTVVFSHFNMWERGWNAMFDTTKSYAEYAGMPETRAVLEQAGNVVAVVNGHVHANRVEVHNGIHYVDVAATLVGPPSIRYFHVRPGGIDVTFSYISDQALADYVTDICPHCCCCFNRDEVCDFIDGQPGDKQFTIPVPVTGDDAAVPAAPAPHTFRVDLVCEGRSVRATVASDGAGTVQVLLTDVLGRSIDRAGVRKAAGDLEMDLDEDLARIRELPAGIYFIRFSLGGLASNKKMVLLP